MISFILTLIKFMISFGWMAVVTTIQFPFTLLSGDSREIGRGFKLLIFNIPILYGYYFIFSGEDFGFGIFLILASMVVGYICAKNNIIFKDEDIY